MAYDPAAMGVAPLAAGIEPFQGDENGWAPTMLISPNVGGMKPFQSWPI